MSNYIPKALTNCRVCGAGIVVFEKFKDMPLESSTLSSHPVNSKHSNVNLYKCPACGHYQIPLISDLPYHSECTATNMKVLMEDRNLSFSYLSSLVQDHDRILEVGCGAGIMFELAEKFFQKVVGVDPSKEAVAKIKEGNHEIINDYFNADLPLGGDFDAFYALQTFEHVDNPLQILKDVYSVLKPGGVGWIEVPNGLTIINEAQYYSIFPDHLNYYTPHSLSALVYLSGFQTLFVRPSLGKDHVEIFFRKPADGFSISDRKEKLCNIILDESSKHSQVVIWGAGGKSHTLFGYLGEKLHVAHVVDTDPVKQGLYLPGASVIVEAPSPYIFSHADLVVIFSASYEREITDTLRNTFAYKGEILCLSNY